MVGRGLSESSFKVKDRNNSPARHLLVALKFGTHDGDKRSLNNSALESGKSTSQLLASKRTWPQPSFRAAIIK